MISLKAHNHLLQLIFAIICIFTYSQSNSMQRHRYNYLERTVRPGEQIPPPQKVEKLPQGELTPFQAHTIHMPLPGERQHENYIASSMKRCSKIRFDVSAKYFARRTSGFNYYLLEQAFKGSAGESLFRNLDHPVVTKRDASSEITRVRETYGQFYPTGKIPDIPNETAHRRKTRKKENNWITNLRSYAVSSLPYIIPIGVLAGIVAYRRSQTQ